MIVIKCR